MAIKHFASIQFNHQGLGFCNRSDILYCFIWKDGEFLNLYVGRNGTSNKTGKSSAFKRLGRHLSNHQGQSATHSVFHQNKGLEEKDFEIKMLQITDRPLPVVEKEVIQCLRRNVVSEDSNVNEIISLFIDKHPREKIRLLNK